MTVDEDRRNQLHNRLGEVLGSDEAGALMEMLPRHTSSELATRDDVLATATLLRGEMAELRAELRGEMAELRGEMAELRSEVKHDIGELRGEVGAMKVELISEFTTKTHQMFLATLMAILATGGFVFAAELIRAST